jgi:hypothetical protein
MGGDPAPWLELLPRYAELQRAEAVHTNQHLLGGVPDRRLAKFPTLYRELLAHASSLGSDQLERLHAFRQRFGELSAELDARGITETIQHDDLHGANVYRRDRELRILDWGDSCLSHPFRTLYVTLEHLFLPRGDPWLGRLRDAYLEPWGRPAELRDIRACRAARPFRTPVQVAAPTRHDPEGRTAPVLVGLHTHACSMRGSHRATCSDDARSSRHGRPTPPLSLRNRNPVSDWTLTRLLVDLVRE